MRARAARKNAQEPKNQRMHPAMVGVGILIRNDFSSLVEVEERLLAFQHHYEQIAVPCQWTFTRWDLAALLVRLSNCALAHVG
jgi:hypothetical protein